MTFTLEKKAGCIPYAALSYRLPCPEVQRDRERHGHSFIHPSIPSHPIETAGSDLQAPSHSVALAKKKQASKRVHELHPTCNYMYMYMYLLRYPYLHVLYSLGPLATCRICTCTVHELSSSIQLEVSYVFIVGKFAQMGSVSPLSPYSLSLSRSL